jgi:hypothetical protein
MFPLLVGDTDNPIVYIFKGKVAQKLNNLSMPQLDDINQKLETNQLLKNTVNWMSAVIYTAMGYWRKTTQKERRIRDNFEIRETPRATLWKKFNDFPVTENALTFFTV